MDYIEEIVDVHFYKTTIVKCLVLADMSVEFRNGSTMMNCKNNWHGGYVLSFTDMGVIKIYYMHENEPNLLI